jgi:hypothetical protein
LWWPSQAVKMPASLARPTSGHQNTPTTSIASPKVGAPKPSSAHQMLCRCYPDALCHLSRAWHVWSRRQSFALPGPNRVMTLDPGPEKETLTSV